MQLPWVTAPEDKRAEQIGSIGDALVSGKKRRDEKQRAAAEQLFRQKQLDQQGQLQQAQIANFQSEADARKHAQDIQDAKEHLAAARDIQAALDAGKSDQANLIAKQYKMPLSQEASPESQRPGNTLMPMSSERPGAPTDEAVQQSAAGSAAAISANPDMNEPGAPPANSPGLVRDLYNSRSAGRFEPQAPIAPKTAAWNIDGQRYDPAQTKAAEDAAREEEAARVESAYKPVGFGPEAGALVRGNTGKAPEVDQAFTATQKAKEAEANRKALLDQREAATMALHERDKLTREEQIAIAAAHDRARVGAAGAAGNAAPKIDAGTRGDYNAGEQALGRMDRNVNLKGIVASDDSIKQAMANIMSPNALQHKDAQVQLAKAVRGTSPTDAETHLLYNNLGGLADRIPQFWAKLESGDLSPEQIRLVQGAIGSVKEHISKQLDQAYGAYREQARDPALANLGPSMNAGVRARFQRVGRDVPDVIEAPGAATPLGAAVKSQQQRQNPLTRAAGRKNETPAARADRLAKMLGIQ